MQVSKVLFVVLVLGIIGLVQVVDEVVVYFLCIDELIKLVFDVYISKIGVKVKFIIDKEVLLMVWIKVEGVNILVDLLFIVDVGNFWQVEQMGLL